MPLYSELSDIQLRKRIAAAERELEQESDLYAELRLMQRLLASREQPATNPLYRNAGSIIDAIELCLDIHETALTRQEIYEALVKGGYVFNVETGRRLITNTLYFHVKSGRIKVIGDLYGRPKWPKAKFVER